MTHPSLCLQMLQELKHNLRRQNFPVEFINDGINRAMDIPLAQLRRTRLKEEKQDEKIPFVTTHNPCNHNIFKSAKRFFSNIRIIRKYEKKTSIINSRGQAPNLRKFLSKAMISSSNTISIKKCGDPRCGTCDLIQEGEGIILKSGQILKLMPQ